MCESKQVQLLHIGVVLSTRLKTTGIVTNTPTNTPGHTIQTYQTRVLTYQTIIRHPKTNLTQEPCNCTSMPNPMSVANYTGGTDTCEQANDTRSMPQKKLKEHNNKNPISTDFLARDQFSYSHPFAL